MPSQSDIQQQITDRILEGLRNGVIPWRKPWSTDGNSGSAKNALSRRAYTGINPILLDLIAMTRGYTSRWWGTYHQWETLGGQVKKRPADVEPGQWGTQIVLYKQIERTVEEDGEQKKHRFPMLRWFTVFNCEQVDGLMAEKLRTAPQTNPSPLTIDYEPDGGVVAPGVPHHNPLLPVNLPLGLSSYFLYKNNNGSTSDSGTSFSLSAGGPASLLVTGGDPYQVTNGAPTAHNNSVIVGPYTVTVTAFDWYANGVLNLDFVSSENNLAPGGGLDNFGRITFLVQLPEPSTFLMAGLGAVGLVAIVRRRKPAGC